VTGLDDWIGRTEQRTDVLHAQPCRFMQATLGREASLTDGDALPPLWHWLFFLEAKPLGALGRDGHPAKGEFLPPVSLPRRMWAGGRFAFHQPLIIGRAASKTSTIKNIAEKQGRSGPLCFVTVAHEIHQDGGLCVVEEHDIVYRADPDPDPDLHPSGTAPTPIQAPIQAPADPAFSEQIQPSEVMLFRYSALTFNGHRIHYDSDYARRVEGYEGLVFHGPLTATLLVDLSLRHVGQTPRSFSFRGTAPLSGLAAFHIQGRNDDEGKTELWARRADGALAMTAQTVF